MAGAHEGTGRKPGNRVTAGILAINILLMAGGAPKRSPTPVSHGEVIYEQFTNGMYERCTNLKVLEGGRVSTNYGAVVRKRRQLIRICYTRSVRTVEPGLIIKCI